MNKITKIDKFGAKIICRFCKDRKFEYNHHPNDCKTCYNCGQQNHLAKFCGKIIEEKEIHKNNYKITSMRRSVCIDNSHLLLPEETVGLDLEKVQGFKGEMIPGWVSIYKSSRKKRHNKTETGDLVYSAKIRQLIQDVKSYATLWSGLSRLDLSERALPFKEVQPKLKEILRGRKVVGVALRKDLEDLGIELEDHQMCDLQEIFKDKNNQPISLKILAYAILNKKIQEFDPNYDKNKVHDPVIDSRITLKVYKKIGKIHPIDGTYQWCRDKVNDAIKSGDLELRK